MLPTLRNTSVFSLHSQGTLVTLIGRVPFPHLDCVSILPILDEDGMRHPHKQSGSDDAGNRQNFLFEFGGLGNRADLTIYEGISIV
mgnify:CR=1 FL=1